MSVIMLPGIPCGVRSTICRGTMSQRPKSGRTARVSLHGVLGGRSLPQVLARGGRIIWTGPRIRRGMHSKAVESDSNQTDPGQPQNDTGLSLQELQLLSQEWWKTEDNTSLRRADDGKVNPETVAAVVLGGGAGDGLYPLTQATAKGAVPLGGAYRLIDIPLSNCIDSGIFKMYVFTQFNSSTLNRYIARTYDFGRTFGKQQGFVEVLTAAITPTSNQWFGGTADAIRQYAWAVDTERNQVVEDILILKADHLYRMDFEKLVQYHRWSGADITMGTYSVDEREACHLPLVKAKDDGRVTRFIDKPAREKLQMGPQPGESPLSFWDVEPRQPEFLDQTMRIEEHGHGWTVEETEIGRPRYLASMGIYVMKKRILFDILLKTHPEANDFGAQIFPDVLESRKVVSYPFKGFWADVSTIRSYYEAHMKMARQSSLFCSIRPNCTLPKGLPASRLESCVLDEAIVNHGCVMTNCSIKTSVIGERQVASGCIIENSVVEGADMYETLQEAAEIRQRGGVPLGIGEGSVVRNTIVSKNCRIGKDCTIANEAGVQRADYTELGFCIQNGIVVIMPNASFPDGTVI